MKPRILFFDVETAPNLAYVWGKYEQNVIDFKEEWSMLCFAYKWQGERSVKVVTREKLGEEAMLKKLWALLDEADIVVAHNGDQFDIKKTNARFIALGMKPPTPFQTVDTKKVAKARFNFNSNKLDDLGRVLGVGRKVKHQGFDLWLGCMSNKAKAWREMARYNKQDVALLERVYLKLLPWINNHPNVSQIAGRPKGCPRCGHASMENRGIKYTKTSSFRVYRCRQCSGYCRARVALDLPKPARVNI